MLYPRWSAALLMLGAVACGAESGTPVGITSPQSPTRAGTAAGDQLRLERTARRLAIALGNREFRGQLRSRLAQSAHREQKLELEQVLREDGNRGLGRLAAENQEDPLTIEKDLEASGSLEIYLPVPQQRTAWKGTEDILVATALRDGDSPVAFNLRGERQILNRTAPPSMPVLALVPSETDFTPGSTQRATCTPETCPTGGEGGSAPQAPKGIYLNQAHIIDLHEDWLRGAPEIEAMFMGPLSDTTKMNLVACANESNPAPRYYDQDKNSWTGSVLIADTLQLERVRAAYPAGTPWSSVKFTVAFWEDDTGRCQIATTVNSWANKLKGSALAVLGGMAILSTDWSQPIDSEAWPFIVQLPLGILGLIGTIGGNDDFIGSVVNRSVWNPLHPDDVIYTTQAILDGGVRNGTATLVWR